MTLPPRAGWAELSLNCAAGICLRPHGMDPRVKPEDDETERASRRANAGTLRSSGDPAGKQIPGLGAAKSLEFAREGERRRREETSRLRRHPSVTPGPRQRNPGSRAPTSDGLTPSAAPRSPPPALWIPGLASRSRNDGGSVGKSRAGRILPRSRGRGTGEAGGGGGLAPSDFVTICQQPQNLSPHPSDRPHTRPRFSHREHRSRRWSVGRRRRFRYGPT